MNNSTTYLIAIMQLLDAFNRDTVESRPLATNFTKLGVPA